MVENSHAILVANIKGGVGKSTLSSYMADYLRLTYRDHQVKIIDADPQGSTFEMLEPILPRGDVRSLGIGGRYDAVNLVTLDSLLRTYLYSDDHLVVIDSGAGRPDSLLQIAMSCRCILVPVSLSWADIRPTIDFINIIQERKDQSQQPYPHIVVVPNRVPPRQRDLTDIKSALAGLDVVLAPGLSELSQVRKQSGAFAGLSALRGTRYAEQFETLGKFVSEYVLGGKLDAYYTEKTDTQTNIVRLRP